MRNIILQKIQNATENQLNLSQLHITDDELLLISQTIVRSRPRLKELFLNGNVITDKGAATLATQLAYLRQLCCLGMQKNQLSIDGVRYLFELKRIYPFLHIHLAGNPIKDHHEVLLLEQQLTSARCH